MGNVNTIESLRNNVLVSTRSRTYEDRNIGADILCSSCRFSQIMRRKGTPNVIVFCGTINALVPPDVVECSRYMALSAMELREMELLALTVDGRVAVQDGSYR